MDGRRVLRPPFRRVTWADGAGQHRRQEHRDHSLSSSVLSSLLGSLEYVHLVVVLGGCARITEGGWSRTSFHPPPLPPTLHDSWITETEPLHDKRFTLLKASMVYRQGWKKFGRIQEEVSGLVDYGVGLSVFRVWCIESQSVQQSDIGATSE